MNIATLVGLVLGTGLIGYASNLSAKGAGLGLGALWDLVSLLIVVGGALAATAVAFKMSEVTTLIKSMKRIFADDEYTKTDIVLDFMVLAEAQRKGDLAKAIESVPETMPFRLKTAQVGCQYIADGQKKEDIRTILENMEEYRSIREGQQANVMKTLGVYTPAFGMVGTLIGLVAMLGNMADPKAIGPAMAVALLTTLYGAMIANTIFMPVVTKLEGYSTHEVLYREMVVMGLKFISRGESPRNITDQLVANLPPKIQAKIEEAAA